MKPITVIIIIGVVILLVFGVDLVWRKMQGQESGQLSEEEKAKIEAWIKENDLNRYGDPKDRVYIGGTPLFDERSGQRIDRYDYILRNHPDRPWLKYYE